MTRITTTRTQIANLRKGQIVKISVGVDWRKYTVKFSHAEFVQEEIGRLVGYTEKADGDFYDTFHFFSISHINSIEVITAHSAAAEEELADQQAAFLASEYARLIARSKKNMGQALKDQAVKHAQQQAITASEIGVYGKFITLVHQQTLVNA